jgi:hypothetical protein
MTESGLRRLSAPRLVASNLPPDRSCRHGQRGPGRCPLSQLPRGTVCGQQDGARQDVEQFEQCRRNGLGGHSSGECSRDGARHRRLTLATGSSPDFSGTWAAEYRGLRILPNSWSQYEPCGGKDHHEIEVFSINRSGEGGDTSVVVTRRLSRLCCCRDLGEPGLVE